jgi:transcriptional regulator with XRE-family HTH domain
MKKSNYTVGRFLKDAREDKKLSLRAVESETGVSNAYLSQLESEKIKEPSPHLLYKLCEFYGISYETAMEMVGYPMPSPDKEAPALRHLAARFGKVTDEEEEELVDYLQFLRARRRGDDGGRR